MAATIWLGARQVPDRPLDTPEGMQARISSQDPPSVEWRAQSAVADAAPRVSLKGSRRTAVMASSGVVEFNVPDSDSGGDYMAQRYSTSASSLAAARCRAQERRRIAT